MEFRYKIKQRKNGKYFAEYKFYKYFPYKQIRYWDYANYDNWRGDITEFDSIEEAYDEVMKIYLNKIKNDKIKKSSKEFNKNVVKNTIPNKELVKRFLKG